MSSKKTRRKFSTEQKAVIIRRHLKDKVAVSDLCDEYKIQPSMFYEWQKQALDNLASALQSVGQQRATHSRESDLERENEALKTKLAKKDHVIAEISEEYVTLKKALGEP